LHSRLREAEEAIRRRHRKGTSRRGEMHRSEGHLCWGRGGAVQPIAQHEEGGKKGVIIPDRQKGKEKDPLGARSEVAISIVRNGKEIF